MYLVRNVFKAKPGKAKDLVAKFKIASPHLLESGIKNVRVCTDTVAGFWTVVVESEVEDLGRYFETVRGIGAHPKLGKIMKGYMDLVDCGHREVFQIE